MTGKIGARDMHMTGKSDVPADATNDRIGEEQPVSPQCVSPRDEHPAGAWLERVVQGQTERFNLEPDRAVRIGRSENNTIIVTDHLISRNHAMLQFLDVGSVAISDLGSSNGTWVNSNRITSPRVLKNGDHISIGSHEFTFHREETETSEVVAEDDELAETNVHFARKLITVLVIDIRDYTGLAQRIDSEKLTKVAGALFREAGKLLQERGAWAQKYIGDAMMAVWLHKSEGPEPGEIMELLGSVQRLLKVVNGLQEQFGLDAPVRIGCGINSGWASVGNVGSIAAADYTALGDVVNMAFRLESATRHASCDLLAGAETIDFITLHEAKSRFREQTVTLKGYEEPVTAFGLQFEELADVLKDAERAKTTDAWDRTGIYFPAKPGGA